MKNMENAPLRILIVDDDEDEYIIIRELLSEIEDLRYDLQWTPSYDVALGWMVQNKHDIYLVDYRLGELDGIELLRDAIKNGCKAPTILMTAHGDRDVNIEAMKAGAEDYLNKGELGAALLERYIRHAIERKQMMEALGKARDDLERQVEVRTAELKTVNEQLKKEIKEHKRAEENLKQAFSEIALLKDRLQSENIYLREEIDLKYKHEAIIGQSDAIKEVLAQCEQVADTDSTVLMLGETGTGKELLARTIHSLSSREGRPMITVNCAALPATLIESEIFGREKGAYTGALTRQIGRFEVADGSTIFLDEISELPLELQAKLLRVLQEGEFERLGSPKTVKVDVRVIAATNRDLAKEVSENRFREDLYYRINVFPITVPPLRDRREDIPRLAWAFIREFEKTMGKRIETIPRKAMEILQHYPWPGNVRELRNVMERAMIISKGNALNVEMPAFKASDRLSEATLQDVEKNHIMQVLKKTRWRVKGKNNAAEILGLKPTTLHSRMKKLGIKRPG